MKLCFSTVGCPTWSWSEITAAAKDLGYDGIEIRGVGPEIYAPKIKQFLPDHISATAASLKEKNLALACLSSGAALAFASDECLVEIEAYAALASRLGAPYVRIMAEPQPNPMAEVDDDLVVSRLKRLAPKAAEKGVTLLLETNGAYCDSKRLKKVLDKAGEGVGALWDIHHPFRFFGESPENTVENLGAYIRHVHLKDGLMQNSAVKYMPMGHGDLPVERCVAALKSAGYGGFFSFEWVKRWYAHMEEPGVVFMQYVHYMKSL